MYKKRYISWRYIVSEYFEAKELGQYKGIISIKDIVKVGRIICQVLEATHSLQLIHRDIKPTNILIPNGKIEDLKLCDFGLAKRTDVSIPVHRSILGSVGFAAPEQIDPKLTYPVDNRADIYGLAATLYFMITDHYPYNEKDAKLLMRKGKQIPRPKPLTDYVNQPELNEILSKALSPYRSNRYKNINEFKTDLDTIYNKL
ncbi:serine/threonine-protein kinase [Candidatus Latescibacterota bacterium]